MSNPASDEIRKFDEYAGSYRQVHANNLSASGEPPEYFAQYKLNCLLRLGTDRGKPILDYGCGIGSVTRQLATEFRDVHAFDPSQESLVVAREQIPGATFYDSHDEIPRNKFSLIVMSGVLHHVPKVERNALLSNVRTLLAEGGRIVVFEHNPINPLTRHAVATCPFDDDAVLLWPWEVKRELTNAGFSAVDLDYIVFFPKSLGFLRSFEPKLSWLLLGAQTMTVAGR